MKFSVTAPDRSSMGFSTYCCAGRHWPGGKPVVVEVLDQAECPRIPHPTREGVQMLDPVRIGRDAWKEIQDCLLLSKNEAPDDAELTLPPANPTEQLKEENRKLREDLAGVKAGIDSRLKAIESGLDSRLAALQASLTEALSKRDAPPAPAAAPLAAPESKPAEAPEPQPETAAPPAATEPAPATPIPARSRRGKG